MDILKKDIMKAQKDWGKILSVLFKNRREIHNITINEIRTLEKKYNDLVREDKKKESNEKNGLGQEIIFDGLFEGAGGTTEILATKKKSKNIKTKDDLTEVVLESTGRTDEIRTLLNLESAIYYLKKKYSEEKYPKVHKLFFGTKEKPNFFTKIEKVLDTPLPTEAEEIEEKLKVILENGDVDRDNDDEVKLIFDLYNSINDFFKGRKDISPNLRKLLVEEGAFYSKVGGWLNQFKIYGNKPSRDILNNIFDKLGIEVEDDIKTYKGSKRLIEYLNLDTQEYFNNIREMMNLYSDNKNDMDFKDQIEGILTVLGGAVTDKTELTKEDLLTLAYEIMEDTNHLVDEITEIVEMLSPLDTDDEKAIQMKQNMIYQINISLKKAKQNHEVLHFTKIILETKGFNLKPSIVNIYNDTRRDISDLQKHRDIANSLGVVFVAATSLTNRDEVNFDSLSNNTFSIKGETFSVSEFKQMLSNIARELESGSEEQEGSSELLDDYESKVRGLKINEKRKYLFNSVTNVFKEIEKKLTITPKGSVKDKDGKRKLVDRNVSQHFEGQSKNPNNPFLDQKTTISRERSEDDMGAIERNRFNLLRKNKEEIEKLWIDFALKFEIIEESSGEKFKEKETSLPKYDEDSTSEINNSEILNYVLLKSNFLNKLVKQNSDLDKQKWAVLALRNANTVRRELSNITNKINTFAKRVDGFLSNKTDEPKGNDITDTDESEYEYTEFNDRNQLK
jgi:hypothetical protein